MPKAGKKVKFEGKEYEIRNFYLPVNICGRTVRLSGHDIQYLLEISEGKWVAVRGPHLLWRLSHSLLQNFATYFVLNLLRPVDVGKYELTECGREAVRAYFRAQEEHIREQSRAHKSRSKLRYAVLRDISRDALEVLDVEFAGPTWSSRLDVSARGPKSGKVCITIPDSVWCIQVANDSTVFRALLPGKPWTQLARWVLDKAEPFVPFINQNQNALKILKNLRRELSKSEE